MTKPGRLFLLLAALWLPAGEARAIAAQEHTLDNGMKVILAPEHKAPVVVSQLWYRVGSVDEIPGRTGLAHMLEHMMFQGTSEVKPGEFSRTIAKNGGQDNAFTSFDFTAYYVKIASDRLELVLKLEADRMRHLKLSQEEFVSENKVVREERRTRTDSDPNQKMLERFRRTLFGKHPYGRPIIGSMEDLERLTLDDLSAWYRRYYAPNNATLVLVGDIDPDRTLEMVRRHFGPLPADPDLKPAPPPVSPPPPVTPQRVEVRDKEATLPLWTAGFVVPSLTTADDPVTPFALDLLSTILATGHASRLNQRLVVKDRLATQVDAGYTLVSRYDSTFTFSAIPKSKVEVAAVEKAIFEELARLVAQPIPERELERAKNTLASDHVYDQDSAYALAMGIGDLAISGGDWRLIQDYPERIRAVGEEDVRRVAARFLKQAQMTVGVLLPAGEEKP